MERLLPVTRQQRLQHRATLVEQVVVLAKAVPVAAELELLVQLELRRIVPVVVVSVNRQSLLVLRFGTLVVVAVEQVGV
jgi:hypothetical protein